MSRVNFEEKQLVIDYPFFKRFLEERRRSRMRRLRRRFMKIIC